MLSLFIAAAVAAEPPLISTCVVVQNLNGPTLQHLIFSPTAGVPVPDHPREAPPTAAIANSGKALGYTRIRASFIPCTGARNYSKERRSGLKRYFFGKNAEKILTMDISLKPGDVKIPSTLSSLTRHSNKQGEDWTTSVHNDRILTPYFRADLGSLLTMEASVKSTRDYDATVGADVLALISQASALITPTTQLLTDQNKDRFKEAANFVDKALDGLLKVAIEEKALSDVQLYPGSNGTVLAVLTVSLPMANNTFANAAWPDQALGQWIVYAEGLRQSIFGDVVDGAVVRSSTSSASVLNYLVAEKKTLREALSGVKSITTARDALMAAADPDKARILCAAIASEAEQLGLAPADVGAAMWAYLWDLALPMATIKLAERGCLGLDKYPQS